MLKHETTKQEDAIEKYFCVPFSKLPKQEMEKDLLEPFIEYTMGKDEDFDLTLLRKKSWVLQAIEKRIEVCFKYTLDNRSKAFLLMVANGNIGVCVMYLTYLQYISRIRGVKEITFTVFSDVFRMGFPSRNDLHELWGATKVEREENGAGSDNLVDYEVALKSILY